MCLKNKDLLFHNLLMATVYFISRVSGAGWENSLSRKEIIEKL